KDGEWKVMNKKYYDEYNKTAHPVKKRRFLQKEKGRILGESTIGGTIEIINHFKPKIWIIENPQTSKTWEFQKNHWDFYGEENLAYYSAYNANFSPKPTIFKSNIKLVLINKRVKGNNDHMSRGSYSKRSSIPKELIKTIIEQVLKYIKS
ncbi:MAG: cytosine methyltransferase, partial [Malacoplasma sp.]